MRNGTKNEKVGLKVGRVLKKIREFSLAYVVVQFEKPFGNQLRVNRSKIDFKK